MTYQAELKRKIAEISNRVKELGIQDDLMNHPGLSLGMLLIRMLLD